MNMQHVISLNNRLHEVKRVNKISLTLNEGKNFAVYYPVKRKLICKHALNGRFISLNVNR